MDPREPRPVIAWLITGTDRHNQSDLATPTGLSFDAERWRQASELDFDVDTTGQVELHERIDGLRAGAEDVDDAAMGPGFEMLA